MTNDENDILDEALIACATGCNEVLDLIQRDDGKGLKFVIYVWPENEPDKGRLISSADISDNELREVLARASMKIGENVRFT